MCVFLQSVSSYKQADRLVGDRADREKGIYLHHMSRTTPLTLSLPIIVLFLFHTQYIRSVSSLSHTFSLTLSIYISVSLTHFLSRFFILSLCISHTLSISLFQSLSFCLPHTFSLTPSISLSVSLTLSHSPFSRN